MIDPSESSIQYSARSYQGFNEALRRIASEH
jgi:hypothetical protein